MVDSPCPLIPQARSLLFGTQGRVAFVLGPQIASVKRPPPSGRSPRPFYGSQVTKDKALVQGAWWRFRHCSRSFITASMA